MGGSLEYLGHIEFDDAVFLSARRRRPLLLDAPNAKASRNVERITRRLLSAESTRLAGHATSSPGEAGLRRRRHYEVLSLDRGASDEEIRRAYRRAREVYASESLALSGLLTGEESSRMVARIEEARDVLLDPSRRRPYDLSITPAEELPTPRATPEVDVEAEAALATANLPPLTPETEYSGALLKLIREARGVDLKDISARTKISMMYLRALEDEDYPMLPAAVYTRGFVTEVAKFLRLDVEQVVRTYLRRFRRAQEA
ncbi:MAG: helix-turn-helix domain-containing protein [Polyangiales bacterium]